MNDMLTVTKRDGTRIQLNPGTIASVRPTTDGDGSFIVCIGGACHTVNERLTQPNVPQPNVRA